MDADDTEKFYAALATQIKSWGRELGFAHIGVSPADNARHAERLKQWLARDYHGEMAYMARHANLRADADALLPGTVRVISARMDYLRDAEDAQSVLDNPSKAYISRYALGRDYHKLMRKRLAQLAERLGRHAGSNHRAFVDSAPVLERGYAEQAGLGWIGKNSMLINSKAGSWFFLGEIYTDVPLPTDPPQQTAHCGSCTTCLEDCPTGAIVAPYQVDARRCISYLTIEQKGAIPEDLRRPMGNRVFGCDDCQLVCPWNKFAQGSAEEDFSPATSWIIVNYWLCSSGVKLSSRAQRRLTNTPYWLSALAGNLAIGLGNAPASAEIIRALLDQRDAASDVAREHIDWAIKEQKEKAGHR